MRDVKDAIRQFILKKYLPGESADNLRDDTALRTSGILDSLATIGVVNFIEKEFAVEIEAHETDVDTFDTIQDMAALVERKRAAAKK
jgi:acyl carrier protein